MSARPNRYEDYDLTSIEAMALAFGVGFGPAEVADAVGAVVVGAGEVVAVVVATFDAAAETEAPKTVVGRAICGLVAEPLTPLIHRINASSEI